jgi:hypothetical protein
MVSAAAVQPAPTERVRVKRDGPRGWHWIAAAHYDPARHELYTEDAPAAAAIARPDAATVEAAPPPAKRGPGRPRKHPIT